MAPIGCNPFSPAKQLLCATREGTSPPVASRESHAMSISDWDLHDVIGYKPPYFYAKILDDYMMSSYKPPAWMDDDEIEIEIADEVLCCDQGCQTDFAEATFGSKQSAEEAVPRRAPRAESTLSIGTNAPHPPVRPAFGRCRSLSTF